MKQRGFFDGEERLARLSGLGDKLEVFSRTVDFEVFRPDLNKALAYADGSRDGRPPFDPVLMFKILDATLVAVPKQRNTNAEKADLRAGEIPQDWQDKPAKLSHKDRHVRWTLKFTKTKRQEDGTIPSTDLAIPFFDYKSNIAIDRKFRLIRKWKATDAAASDGARLR